MSSCSITDVNDTTDLHTKERNGPESSVTCCLSRGQRNCYSYCGYCCWHIKKYVSCVIWERWKCLRNSFNLRGLRKPPHKIMFLISDFPLIFFQVNTGSFYQPRPKKIILIKKGKIITFCLNWVLLDEGSQAKKAGNHCASHLHTVCSIGYL